MRKEIDRDRRRIDYLISKYDFFNNDYYLMSHYTRYLCVVICGYLEKSVQRIMKEYAKNKSHENIARYVNIQIEAFQNAKAGKIVNLIGLYNVGWSKDISKYINGEIKESIDGMVNTRHQIAHGENIYLTPNNLINYYKNINKFIDYLWYIINDK